MKKVIAKILLILCVIAMAVLPCFVCFSEEFSAEPSLEVSEEFAEAVIGEQPEIVDFTVNQFYTWEYLATIAGATAATLLIVEFLKFPLDKVWKVPTRVVVYVIALAIVLAATYFTGGLTLDKGLMCVLNAFMVSLSAYGSYELTFAKIGK